MEGVEVRPLVRPVALYWQCELHGTRIHVWPEGSRNRRRAEEDMAFRTLPRPPWQPLTFTPMDQELLFAFLDEIAQQALRGFMAVSDLELSLRKGDHAGVWDAISVLLSAAANVSKVLWPPSGERTELVDYLRIGRSGPLADRRLRNHFEHMDERLERWGSRTHRRPIVDGYIGPKHQLSSVHPKDLFRTFDPATNLVTFHGDEVWITGVVGDLGQVVGTLYPPDTGKRRGTAYIPRLRRRRWSSTRGTGAW